MPVPYGFGIGDIVAVGTLAWNVYKSCKAAPESFGNISVEVLSLHAVLKEGEEILFTHPLPPARAERLSAIKDGCDRVLADLQSLVQKYESLGTKSKRTWDRMKWGNKDITEIRARLTSNATMLTAFISTSQVSVEAKLDKFIEEFHQGKKEGSVVSLQTVDSLSADDRAVWRTIRKELEDIGISVAAFDVNRNFIFDWFVRAVETGAFEEQNEYGNDNENNYRDEQGSWSDDEQDSQDMGRRIEHTDSKSLGGISDDQPLAPPQLSESTPDAEPSAPKRGLKTSDQNFTSPRIAPKPRTRVPRVAALLARMSFPRQRLLNAIMANNCSKALMILKDEASSRLLDSETLDKALCTACSRGSQVRISDTCLLISQLISSGGNVNCDYGGTPLWNSVANGSIDIVRILVENGADVNRKNPGAYTDRFAPRECLQNELKILRFLLLWGVNINARYRWNGSWINLIHEAAYLRAVPAIKVLLQHGAAIDAISPQCGTALMLALAYRREVVAQILLVEGADPNFEAASGKHYSKPNLLTELTGLPMSLSYKSPLEAAIISVKPSMMKLLLDHGAVPDGSTLEYVEERNRLKSRSWERESRLIEIKRMLEDKMNGKDMAESPTTT